jgi:hypothetical protein
MLMGSIRAIHSERRDQSNMLRQSRTLVGWFACVTAFGLCGLPLTAASGAVTFAACSPESTRC